MDRGGLRSGDPAELLRAAVGRGISYIDTAAAYGASLYWLGQLSDLLRANQVRLCNKLSPSALEDGMMDSLRQLRCDQLDTLLVHSARRADLLDTQIAEAMNAAKEAGLTVRCGASTYGADDACLALEQAWCDVVQLEFSIVNPSVMRDVVAHRRPGQEVVVRSVLGQGMLSARRHQSTHLDDGAMAVLDALEARGREWGLRLEHLAIRFALDTYGVAVVLVGAGNLDELDTALGAADAPPLEPWQLESLAQFDRSREDWTHPERWEAQT